MTVALNQLTAGFEGQSIKTMLDQMIESTVKTTIKQYEWETRSEGEDKLRVHYSVEGPKNAASVATSDYSQLASGYTDVSRRLNTETCEMKKLRRRVFQQKSYRTWFGVVDILTYEENKSYLESQELSREDELDRIHNTEMSLSTRNTTVIDIQGSPWLLGQGFRLHMARSTIFGTSTFNMSLKPYKIVSTDSEIVRAVCCADLEKVQRLFRNGLARPSDRSENGDSLLYLLLQRMMFSIDDTKFEADWVRTHVDMVLYLLSMGTLLDKSTNILIIWWMFKFRTPKPYTIDFHAKLIRLMVDHSQDDSFPIYDDGYLLGLKKWDSIAIDILQAQEKWPVDLTSREVEGFPGRYVENDRFILEDIEASGLIAALARGHQYLYTTFIWFQRDISRTPCCLDVVLDLLLQASGSNVDSDVAEFPLLKTGYQNRIAAIFRYEGITTSSAELCANHSHHFIGCEARVGSVSEIAEAAVGYEWWQATLEKARCNTVQIREISDANLYAGLSRLFDCSKPYMSRADCRQKFEDDLRHGFTPGSMTAEEDVTTIAYNVHLPYYNVRRMIQAAQAALATVTIPGCWPDTEECELIPGVDYPDPADYYGSSGPVAVITNLCELISS